MLLDLENLLCNDQSLVIAAADAASANPSTNVIDFGAAGTPHQSNALAYDKSTGKWKPLLIQITETCVGPGATLTISVEVDSTSAFSSATQLWSSGAIPVATLVAGYRFLIDKLPPLTSTQRADFRYLRLTFDVTTADLTDGSITAGFVPALQTNGL